MFGWLTSDSVVILIVLLTGMYFYTAYEIGFNQDDDNQPLEGIRDKTIWLVTSYGSYGIAGLYVYGLDLDSPGQTIACLLGAILILETIYYAVSWITAEQANQELARQEARAKNSDQDSNAIATPQHQHTRRTLTPTPNTYFFPLVESLPLPII